mmetsp:Transcript_40555/g.100181  ORF Transcript_40555/g.100181 Transcript_40555/m.100181 type:complete len:236 (-) Transcript_40555:694-1401(-)
MWAWVRLPHEYVLVLDSDFALLRPVDLAAVVAEHGRALYIATRRRHRRRRRSLIELDKLAVATAAQLLGVPPIRVPLLDMPWVFERGQRLEMHARLRARHGDYIGALLDPKAHGGGSAWPVFEIIIFRTWQIRCYASWRTDSALPADALRKRLIDELIDRHRVVFLFDAPLTREERARLRYPAVAAYVDPVDNEGEELAWLLIHTDRINNTAARARLAHMERSLEELDTGAEHYY